MNYFGANTYLQAVEENRLEFVPSYYYKLWNHFLEKTKKVPWCISRQLWWGHNIPAYRLVDLEKRNEVMTATADGRVRYL